MWFCKRHLHVTTRHSKLSAKQIIIQHLLSRPIEASIHFNYQPKNWHHFLSFTNLATYRYYLHRTWKLTGCAVKYDHDFGAQIAGSHLNDQDISANNPMFKVAYHLLNLSWRPAKLSAFWPIILHWIFPSNFNLERILRIIYESAKTIHTGNRCCLLFCWLMEKHILYMSTGNNDTT